MNRHGGAEEAIEWAASLAPRVAAIQPLPLARAESYSCSGQWAQLRDFLQPMRWEKAEGVRLSIASHAARHFTERGESSAEASSLWNAALSAAQGDAAQLLTMEQMCDGLGYTDQAEQGWWLVAKGRPGASGELDALQRHYRQQQNARGLQRVAQRALQLNPDDAVAANNCASLGLLLQNDSSASRLAGKLHEQYPATSLSPPPTHSLCIAMDAALRRSGSWRSSKIRRCIRLPWPPTVRSFALKKVTKRWRAKFLPSRSADACCPEEEALLRSAAEKADNS